jgi:hypothetical protein
VRRRRHPRNVCAFRVRNYVAMAPGLAIAFALAFARTNGFLDAAYAIARSIRRPSGCQAAERLSQAAGVISREHVVRRESPETMRRRALENLRRLPSAFRQTEPALTNPYPVAFSERLLRPRQ